MSGIVWSEFPAGKHRIACTACGRKPNDKTMGVTVAGDGHGVAHCFRCGHVEASDRGDREMTSAERKALARRMDAMRRQREAEQRQRHAQAAAAAVTRWAAAVPAQDHPYLTAKGVRAHGLRVEASGLLLIPVRDAAGSMHSLQSIAPDGGKLFLRDGRKKGCHHAIGRPAGRLIVCEGYATGATLHETTGDAVAVAFDASNLLPVAVALRAKYPCLTIVIAADDDWKTEGNPGLTAAKQAAQAVGGKVAVPDFTGLPRGDKDTDFNDLARLAGAVTIGGEA